MSVCFSLSPPPSLPPSLSLLPSLSLSLSLSVSSEENKCKRVRDHTDGSKCCMKSLLWFSFGVIIRFCFERIPATEIKLICAFVTT